MEVQKLDGQLDSNIKELQDNLVKHQDAYKKLIKDKKVLMQNIAMISGAIQAYQGCKQIITTHDASNEVIVDGAA